MACRQTCSNKAVVHERVQRGKPGLWRLFGATAVPRGPGHGSQVAKGCQQSGYAGLHHTGAPESSLPENRLGVLDLAGRWLWRVRIS